ncbi:MAG TPA: ABC transporter permease [Puia sp.]|jgi:putative ABC transport system permease protein
MFRNYFRIAFRHLRKDRGFAFINIFGLAAGLAVCLLIVLFVTDEFGYDTYNKKADRIFRIVSDIRLNGNSNNSNYTPSPMGATLVKDYPSVEKSVRIRRIGDLLIKMGNEKVPEPDAVFADSTLFDVFTLPLLGGDPHTALVAPYSMVISETMAKKYFHSTDILGRTLVTDDTTTYKITGVMKDMPSQSHFHFHFIKAMSERKPGHADPWVNLYSTTYVLARPGVDGKDIDRMLASIVTHYVGPQLQQNHHSSLSDLAKNGDYFRFYSMPLTRIHLYSHVSFEFEPNGSIQDVYIFVIIAVFILLIACSNFMNLSTARSADRAREVGVRKVLGSSRKELMLQFLAESVLTSLVALLLAIGITALLLPYFNRWSGKHISILVLGGKWMLSGLLLSSLAVGSLAGSYPALYLSAFQPIQVLKGRLAAGFRGSWLRNGLVVAQFVTAIALITGALVIYRQLNYIHNRDLGFNREQVLTVSNTNNLGPQARLFEEEVDKLPGITGSTMTGCLPGRINYVGITYFKEGAAKGDQAFLLWRWQVDANYIPLLGMKILRGRNFSPVLSTDSSGVLINETAARLLGYPDPIGKPLYRGPGPDDAFHIIGLVKDFNAETLHNKTEPIVFQLEEDRRAVSFRIHTHDLPGLIAGIKERYRSMPNAAGQPFIYSFLDDDFNKLYKADERTGQLFVFFALLAIFIACLGLFGLVSYAAERRTKEIGIRKVMGATVTDVVRLLSKDFLRLVILAAVIACPIAWWGMHQWLQGFAYRTEIGWWIFVLSGALAVMITMLTVGFQAMKAAMVNPVLHLRTE